MDKILVSVDGRIARESGDIFYPVEPIISNCIEAKDFYQAEVVELVSDEEMDEIQELFTNSSDDYMDEPEIDESMNPYDGTYDWENDNVMIGLEDW